MLPQLHHHDVFPAAAWTPLERLPREWHGMQSSMAQFLTTRCGVDATHAPLREPPRKCTQAPPSTLQGMQHSTAQFQTSTAQCLTTRCGVDATHAPLREHKTCKAAIWPKSSPRGAAWTPRKRLLGSAPRPWAAAAQEQTPRRRRPAANNMGRAWLARRGGKGHG